MTAPTTTAAKEPARCRHCGKLLRGTAYMYGGHAYHPDTGKQCPVNYYGGYVCSEHCDRQALFAMESSFPGAGPCKSLTQGAQRKLTENWRQA